MLLLALKIISLPVPVLKDISIAFLAKSINVFFSSQLIVIILRTEQVNISMSDSIKRIGSRSLLEVAK